VWKFAQVFARVYLSSIGEVGASHEGQSEMNANSSMKTRARGVMAAMPSLFDGHGEPDLPTMERLTDWYLGNGVHGLFVLGSMGLGPASRIDQRKAIAEAVVGRVRGRVPVILHIGASEPYTSVELGEHARSIGVDAVAIVGPYYYNDRTEWDIIEHFKMVDAATRLPILLYNNRHYSGYPMPPEFVARLRDAVPNLFGMKLADGTIRQATEFLNVLSSEFVLFIPIDMMLPGMLIGVKGSTASGVPVTVPEAGVQMVEAIWAGDHLRAQKIQVLMIEHAMRMAPLRKIYGRTTTLEGLRMRGIAAKQYARWPSKPMSAEHLKLYEQHMARIVDGVRALSVTAVAAE
jgi:dihydrodipicolinate synthase/N-acetylneuraminate lyase